MSKRKLILGGVAAAAAGYLYFKHRDFEYDATFETELEVVEEDEPQEASDSTHDSTHEHGGSTDDEETAASYDGLVEASLDVIRSSDREQTNIYAVEPYEDAEGVSGTPEDKYDDIEGNPDILVSSFAGRSLVVIVREEDALDDTTSIVEELETASRPGFSVFLVVPDTETARNRGAAIEEEYDEGTLFVGAPEDIADAL